MSVSPHSLQKATECTTLTLTHIHTHKRTQAPTYKLTATITASGLVAVLPVCPHKHPSDLRAALTVYGRANKHTHHSNRYHVLLRFIQLLRYANGWINLTGER